MKKELDGMTVDELEEELQRIKENLEDLEETFTYNLTHTTAHLRSGLVQEHEDELNEYRERMKLVEALLKQKA